MEPISWEKIASSKPLRFLVGPQKREFTIHSAVVEHHSPVLDKLFNNTNFKEGQDGYAESASVDEDAFIHFIQYAYTGDYDAADELPSTDEGLAQPAAPVHISSPRPDKKKKKKAATKLSSQATESEVLFSPKNKILWTKFKDAACQASNLEYQPSINTLNTVAENARSNGLLRHARLYVFADCYDIAGLMHLTMHNLGQALIAFNLDDRNAEDIVVLLQYCYDAPAPETLKSLLVLYAACHVERLWKMQTFQELLAMHGELSTGLVGFMLERLD